MAGTGGVGAGGAGYVGVGGKYQPPRIFAKVVSIYSPLVLPIVLHDLPKNYMKSLPKLTGEGDLIATEHIAFFHQFVDILCIEHEDIYTRLLVQTFEEKVITWFRGLPVGSIRSYNDLETSFLRQQGEKKYHLYYLIWSLEKEYF
jgi:hypothetical protein